MRISVVTPSYNQADFIEETIDSVLSQGAKDLEYIVVDGGSTDGSVEIIKKYEKHLKYWISEPDEGQTHAIEKGFRHATGNVLCYLNSDDVFFDGVVNRALAHFEANENLDLLYGDIAVYYPDGRLIGKPKISFDFDICLNAFLMVAQPSSFWSRRVYDAVGGFDTSLQFCFDYDYYLKVGEHLKGHPDAIENVYDLFAKFRVHEKSKTISDQASFSRETKILRNRYGFISNPVIRPFIKYFYLSKTLYRFYRERGMIPLSSGPGSL